MVFPDYLLSNKKLNYNIPHIYNGNWIIIIISIKKINNKNINNKNNINNINENELNNSDNFDIIW